MALLQEIQVPLLAVNDTTLTVSELSYATGTMVKKGDVVMVLETSKTTYDVEAAADGFIQYLCEAGRDYEVNTPIAFIYSEAAEAASKPLPGPVNIDGPAKGAIGYRQDTPVQHPAHGSGPYSAILRAGQPSAPPRFWEGETIFSREAMRLMATAGLENTAFAGKDFVTGADVRDFLTQGMSSSVSPAMSPSAPTAKSATTASAPAGYPSSPANRPAPAILSVDPAKAVLEKLASAKKREIEYLSEVQSTGLTSTINTYVDTEGIFIHINQGLRYLKDSLLPIIIYETGRLLADYPPLNGYFTGETPALYKDVNPGFAIDIDKGLKVLKIADAGQKSIGEIESEILQLSGQYLDDTLRIDQLTDITFTITDLSSEGVAFFRPLINKMNSAILGISAIDAKLQRCILSLTFDHRMTEGRLAARFLHELKGRLESYRPKDVSGLQDISCFKCYKTLKEDLGGTGFVRCITPEGKDGYICQSCIKGF